MVYGKNILKQNAYTLLEIIIVIIIISAIVSLAIPKYTTTLEKARLGEGLQIMEALYKAQRAFSFENNGAFTNNLNLLDVTIPAPRYFGAPIIATLSPIATITRIGGSYTLFLNPVGRITCGPLPTCNRIGCQGGVCN